MGEREVKFDEFFFGRAKEFEEVLAAKKFAVKTLIERLHKNPEIQTMCYKIISGVKSYLYDTQFISLLKQSLRIGADVDFNVEDYFTFYVKGGTALALLSKEFQYTAPGDSSRDLFDIESDWDTNLLVNPELDEEIFQIVFELVSQGAFHGLLTTIEAIKSDAETYKRIKQAVMEIVESYNNETKSYDEEKDPFNLNEIKFWVDETNNPNYQILNSTNSVIGILQETYGPINTFFGLTDKGNIFHCRAQYVEIVNRANDHGKTIKFDSYFILERVWIRLRAYKTVEGTILYTNYLPFELVDISVPNRNDNKVCVNWLTHQTNIKFNYFGQEIFVWSPLTNLIDLALLVFENTQRMAIGLAGDPKIEKRMKRFMTLLDAINKCNAEKLEIMRSNYEKLSYIDNEFGPFRQPFLVKDILKLIKCQAPKSLGEYCIKNGFPTKKTGGETHCYSTKDYESPQRNFLSNFLEKRVLEESNIIITNGFPKKYEGSTVLAITNEVTPSLSKKFYDAYDNPAVVKETGNVLEYIFWWWKVSTTNTDLTFLTFRGSSWHNTPFAEIPMNLVIDQFREPESPINNVMNIIYNIIVTIAVDRYKNIKYMFILNLI